MNKVTTVATLLLAGALTLVVVQRNNSNAPTDRVAAESAPGVPDTLEKLERRFQAIEQLVRRDVDIREAWEALIDTCEATNPSARWKSIRTLDVESGLAEVKNWVARMWAEHPPAHDASGLWFGLFNPVQSDGSATADIYVAGGEYRHGGSDWLAETSPWTQGYRSESKFLSALYREAYQQGAPGNDAEDPLALGFSALAIRALAEEMPQTLAAGSRRVLVVGWDSGDFIYIGEVSPQGFVPSLDSQKFAPRSDSP